MDRERVLNKKRERKGEKQKGSEERKNNSLHRIKGKFIVMLPSDVSIRDAFFFKFNSEGVDKYNYNSSV